MWWPRTTQRGQYSPKDPVCTINELLKSDLIPLIYWQLRAKTRINVTFVQAQTITLLSIESSVVVTFRK